MSKHSRRAKRLQRGKAKYSAWLAQWLEAEIKCGTEMARFLADANGETLAQKPKA